jgi:hypothetical protein
VAVAFRSRSPNPVLLLYPAVLFFLHLDQGQHHHIAPSYY